MRKHKSKFDSSRVDRHVFQVRPNAVIACAATPRVLAPLGWTQEDVEALVAQVIEVESHVAHGVKFSRIGFVDDPVKASPAFYVVRSGPGVFANHEIVFNLSNAIGINPKRYTTRYSAFSRYMIAHAMGHHILAVEPECIQGAPPPIPESIPESMRPMILAQTVELIVEKIAEALLGRDKFMEGLAPWLETVLEYWTNSSSRSGKHSSNHDAVSCVCGW